MKYAISVVIVIVLAAVTATAQCSETDKKALVAFDKQWSDTNAKGERTAIAAIYADEFATVPSMTGKAAAVDGAVAAFERNKANPQGATQTTTDHYMITCTPTTATVVHRNIVFNPVANDGKGATNHSRSVHFLEKRNGKWVAVTNVGGPLSDADMIRYMELDWMEAMKSKNFDWFEKNLASDYTDVSFVNGALSNKRQSIDGMKADKTSFDWMEVSDLNIRVDGNTAIVTGVGYGRGKMADGKPFDMKLRFTDTFIKRDGRWLAWASQSTQLPEPATTAKN